MHLIEIKFENLTRVFVFFFGVAWRCCIMIFAQFFLAPKVWQELLVSLFLGLLLGYWYDRVFASSTPHVTAPPVISVFFFLTSTANILNSRFFTPIVLELVVLSCGIIFALVTLLFTALCFSFFGHFFDAPAARPKNRHFFFTFADYPSPSRHFLLADPPTSHPKTSDVTYEKPLMLRRRYRKWTPKYNFNAKR